MVKPPGTPLWAAMLIRAGASKEDSWLHRDAQGRMGEQAPEVLTSLGEQALLAHSDP